MWLLGILFFFILILIDVKRIKLLFFNSILIHSNNAIFAWWNLNFLKVFLSLIHFLCSLCLLLLLLLLISTLLNILSSLNFFIKYKIETNPTISEKFFDRALPAIPPFAYYYKKIVAEEICDKSKKCKLTLVRYKCFRWKEYFFMYCIIHLIIFLEWQLLSIIGLNLLLFHYSWRSPKFRCSCLKLKRLESSLL